MLHLIGGVASLTKYLSWADAMRKHFELTAPKMDKENMFATNSLLGMMYLNYWFATLYVVIEGYRVLKLSDPDVDQLLLSPNVKTLRLYRNGVYHFQVAYFDKRYTTLWAARQDIIPWIRKVREAMHNCINQWDATHNFDGSPKTYGISEGQ